MKTTKRAIGVLLVMSVLVCNLFSTAIAANAVEENHMGEEATAASVVFPSLFGGGGDQYGYVGWGSLSDAKAYYGYDLSYYACNHTYNNVTYNYYYTFSDNSRMYFGVRR